MRYCTCERPTISARYPDSCVCGRRLENWPAKLAAWFDRLEELGLPGDLRRMCEAREVAGRVTFGQRFLHRNNIEECYEEIADAVLYLALHDVQQDTDDEITRGLTAAHHIALAWAALTD